MLNFNTYIYIYIYILKTNVQELLNAVKKKNPFRWMLSFAARGLYSVGAQHVTHIHRFNQYCMSVHIEVILDKNKKQKTYNYYLH